MSSHFIVLLKEKDRHVNNAVELFYLSTTPARNLAQEVNLVYAGGSSWNESEEEAKARKNSEYGYYTILNDDLYAEITNYYEEREKRNKEWIQGYKDRIKRLEERITKCTPELYDKINEEIYSEQSGLEETIKESEYDTWEYMRWKLKVGEVFSDNTSTYCSKDKPKYELVYYYA